MIDRRRFLQTLAAVAAAPAQAAVSDRAHGFGKLQADKSRIIDLPAIDLGFAELASVRASFALPLICFIVIALYGWRTFKIHRVAEKTT